MGLMKVKRYYKKHGKNEVFDEMFGRLIEKRVKNKKRPRPVLSLIDEERIRWNDEAESRLHYGFVEADEDMSEEEIREELYEMMEVRICSPYDCTGKWFTQWITCHRNPSGLVSYVHSMGLDV